MRHGQAVVIGTASCSFRGSQRLLLRAQMKFQRIEFSWRAAFVGLYLTPDGDKLWVTIIPFLPLYFKKVGGAHAA